MKNEISEDFNKTINTLAEVISSFPDDKYNIVPFEGSWTSGQTAEHILKGNSGIPEVLEGTTKKSERAHNEKIGSIKDLMLDFNTKLKSPEFIDPPKIDFNKKEHLKKLENIKQATNEVINTKDLSELAVDFEIPGFGGFTRYEWIYFMIYHTQRHTHQLRNILKELK